MQLTSTSQGTTLNKDYNISILSKAPCPSIGKFQVSSYSPLAIFGNFLVVFQFCGPLTIFVCVVYPNATSPWRMKAPIVLL
jgi:hypothetical protein